MALAAGLPVLCAQPPRSGPQLASFRSSVDDSQQPYALYLPANLDPSRKYPLLISLHQEDSNARINLMRVFGEINRFADGTLTPLHFLRPVRNVDFIVASPQARGTMGYQGIAERDIYDLLADLERRYPVDEDRVYLTGISMGGAGALRLALTRPDVWAAVAAICPAPIPGDADLAGNALNLPVRLFQGNQDPIVPAASSREWQRRFLDLGVAADYFEYPILRHNAWDLAYKNGALFDWLARFRRNRSPGRVRFVTDSYRYSSAYWVRIDGLTPGVEASIDARQVGANVIEIQTRNIEGFTLSLDRPVSVIEVDDAVLRVKPAVSVSLRKKADRWVAGRLPPAGKGPGAEGPIAEAVSGPQLYVYGTAGSPSADELNERRSRAEAASRWSDPRHGFELQFPVKADASVTDQDLDRYNLVLFGNRESNSLIARFAGRFPLALNAGAADFGLLFIAPIGKHYALVNSGLPWWTGADEAGRRVDPFEPRPFAELASFGDYIVFEGGLSHVIAEGRFDSDWKLPSSAAARLHATGTITVR